MSSGLRWMDLAIFKARQGLGKTAPNPSVGCVIVKNERVVGCARTANGGRPHAETIALGQAGNKAEGADVYVTLEPCSHYGQTGPCAQALIEAKVKRVFIGTQDISSHVNGEGIKRIQAAGIETVLGLRHEKCLSLKKGFFLTVTENRPLVTLKLATSLDGKIATASGQSQWITGPLARRYGHAQRAIHDAILVGRGTLDSDNPKLDCRLPGVSHKLTRIILDSALNTSPESKIFKDKSGGPVWIIYDTYNKNAGSLKKAGANLYKVSSTRDLREVLEVLSDNGVTRLLVEGGGLVNASFMKSGLIDTVLWFRSSKVLGGDGVNGIGECNVNRLKDASILRLLETVDLGEDWLEILDIPTKQVFETV